MEPEKKRKTIDSSYFDDYNMAIHEQNKRKDYKMRLKGKKRILSLYEQASGVHIVYTTDEQNYLEIKYFKKFFLNEFLNAFYAFFSILSMGSYFEFSIDIDYIPIGEALPTRSMENKENYFLLYLYACSLLTVCLITNLFLESLLRLEYDVKRKAIPKNSNLWNSGRLTWFLLKAFLFLPHPNILTETQTYQSINQQITITSTIKINYILCIACLFRFYFVFRFLIYFSGYMNPDSDRVCKKYYFDANLTFSFKCLISDRPVQTYAVTLLIMLYSFAISIRVFEKDLAMGSPPYKSPFRSIWTAMYYVLVTMTTLGYGDYTPFSNEGRVIAMISCIFGVFLTSMMIISVNKLIEMSLPETNSLFILERINDNEELQKSAKGVFLNLFKILKSGKPLSQTKIIRKRKSEIPDKLENELKKNLEKPKIVKNSESDINSRILFKNMKNAIEDFKQKNNSKLMNENNFNSVFHSLNLVMNEQDEFTSKDLLFQQTLSQISQELNNIKELLGG